MLATLTHRSPWASRKQAAALLLWVSFPPICGAATEAGASPPVASGETSPILIPPIGALSAVPRFVERLLVVGINRQKMDQPVIVLESKTGELYLWRKDLQRWRLRLPDAAAEVIHQKETYFPLSAMAYVSHAYDPKELTLMIELRADAFISSRLTTRYDSLPPPVKPGPGGFINYDVVVVDADRKLTHL